MRRNRDWLALTVRFLCGVPFGAIGGLSAAADIGTKPTILTFVLVGALVAGALSALLGDTFWESGLWSLWW